MVLVKLKQIQNHQREEKQNRDILNFTAGTCNNVTNYMSLSSMLTNKFTLYEPM